MGFILLMFECSIVSALWVNCGAIIIGVVIGAHFWGKMAGFSILYIYMYITQSIGIGKTFYDRGLGLYFVVMHETIQFPS